MNIKARVNFDCVVIPESSENSHK